MLFQRRQSVSSSTWWRRTRSCQTRIWSCVAASKLWFQDQDFSWKFLLADLAFPIPGMDFLRFHKLLYKLILNAIPCLIAQAGGSPARCGAAHPMRQWWSTLYSRTSSLFSTHRSSSQRRTSKQGEPSTVEGGLQQDWVAGRGLKSWSGRQPWMPLLQEQTRPSFLQHTWLIPQ